MGTAAISELGKLPVSGQLNGTAAAAKKEDDEIWFADMMSQMAQPGTELFAQNDTFISDGNDQVDTITSVEEYDRYQYRDNNVRTKAPESSNDITDETTEKLEEFAGEVTEVLKEELGVTDAQITEAMNTLGITVIDLVDPKQLASLVAELTGCQDMSALLCDEGFLTIMQSVGSLSESLLKELGMTREELTQLLELQTEAPDVEVSYDEVIGQQNQLVEGQGTVKAETVSESTVTAETVTEEQVLTDVKQQSVSDAEEVTQSGNGQEIFVKDKVSDAEQMDSNSFSQQEQSQKQSGAQHNVAPTVNENATPVNQQVETSFVPSAEGVTVISEQVDVANIIRQIAEVSRVTIGNTATTLEMQLNPENLGKLYLEITSKDGNVSAHIMAQNETVKEALEMQLVELRQSMNQAGIKVDAVEVTVGSHEFEKNLEQNARQQEQQAEEQEKAAKHTRHINLSDLDGLSGIMSEEESLVARMMADQGNTVDFTA